MWFILSLVALFCWSGSDLFSKIGCRSTENKYNALKMIIAVGIVMGLHCLYSIVFGGVSLNLQTVITYLPVSLLYILSMLLGYIGLRYIELSISSPICNSSGAVVAIICLITGTLDSSITGGMKIIVISAIAIISFGVIGIGFVEAKEDATLREMRQKAYNFKYTKSWLALALPIAYCLLDAAGTFADSLVLQKLDEDAANCAYELTFFVAAVICFIYVTVIRKEKYFPKKEAPKYLGAIFETAGQFAYIYALSDTGHVAISAPIISSYCVLSVLWSGLFLKEKLSKSHYFMISLVIVGIIIIGVFDL